MKQLKQTIFICLLWMIGVEGNAEVYSGTAGKNIQWTLDTETGLLVLTGSGNMYNYQFTIRAPWDSYREYIIQVNIGDDITSIGAFAFYDCSSLTSIEIPNSVTGIGTAAFEGCSSLPVIDNVRYAGSFLVEAVDKTLPTCNIKDGTRFIGSNAFIECTALTSIEIPNSVTSIESSAFYGCSGLTSIEIPNSVTSIGQYAFYGCSGLTSIEIPNSVTSIESNVFGKCSNITSINLPNSINYIADNAFYDCDLSKINTNAYNDKYILRVAPSFDKESFDVPAGVVKIFPHAFQQCKQIKKISIPNSVQEIGEYAFNRCTNLKSINIPTSIVELKNNLFEYCISLTDIENSDALKSIGGYCFHGCEKLPSIYIPATVTDIKEGAFKGCSSLHSITSYAVVPPKCEIDVMKEINMIECSLNVPNECSNRYMTADTWENFMEINEIGNTIESYAKFNKKCQDWYGEVYYDYYKFKDKKCIIPSTKAWEDFRDRHSDVFTVDIFQNVDAKNEILAGWFNSITPSLFSTMQLNAEEILCVDGRLYVVDYIEDSFMSYFAYYLCNPTRTFGAESYTKNCIVPPSIVNCDPSWNVPENRYYEFSPTSTSANPYVGFEIPKSLFPGISYKVNIAIAPNTNDPEDKRPNYFRVNLYERASSGNNYGNYPSSGKVIQYEGSNFITAGGEKCDTISLTYVPSEYSISHILQLQSNITSKMTSTYDRSIRIAAIWYTLDGMELTKVSKISFDKSSMTLNCNDSGEIFSTILPDTASIQNLEWSSSDENIAIVNNGFVTAISPGTATITAKTLDGSNLYASCEVTVFYNEKPNFIAIDRNGNNVDKYVKYGDDITIDDTYQSLYISEDIDDVDVSFSRTYKDTSWQPWYVPFGFNLTSGIASRFSFAKFAGTYTIEDQFYVAFVKIKDGDEIKANTPYFVCAKTSDSGEPQVLTINGTTLYATDASGFKMFSAEKEIAICGTYAQKVATADDNWYLYDEGIYMQATTEQSLDAFRFYLTINDRVDNPYSSYSTPNPAKIKVIILNDDADGIEDIYKTTGPQDNKLFNLAGQPVGNNYKGIVIKNGRKILYR